MESQLIHYSEQHIEELDRIFRLHLINSVTGYKSANLIGTKSSAGITNLAIFSSVTHLGSAPPVVGFVMRPTTVPRDTLANIRDLGYYTINHVAGHFTDKAHYTSAKLQGSEFKHSALSEEYLERFPAPFVREAPIKMGMQLLEEIPIKSNSTLLVVGQIKHLFVPDHCLNINGKVDLNRAQTVCISGLNEYHLPQQTASYPYARPGCFPENQIADLATDAKKL